VNSFDEDIPADKIVHKILDDKEWIDEAFLELQSLLTNADQFGTEGHKTDD
jgi:hypothetical protein